MTTTKLVPVDATDLVDELILQANYDGDAQREEMSAETKAARTKVMALIAATSALSPWRPIAEAPRDGTIVIVGWRNRLGNWRQTFATYVAAGTLEDDGDDADEHGYAPEGWYEECQSTGEVYRLDGDATPTHWRPVDASPAPATEEG